MAPPNPDVASVVDEVLIAAEGIGFGESRRAAGDKRERLVVAEPREDIVRGGERLIQTGVELGFVQSADRLVDVVVSLARIIGIRRRIDIDYCLANAVDQV